MDPRLRGRIDPEDVLQESLIDVTKRLADYESSGMDLFLWVRFLTGQKLLQLSRRHLGAAARDVRREQALEGLSVPEASSFLVASALLARQPSPSQVAMREEEHEALERALDDMDSVDREVLVMRHFERLSTAEIAQLLRLSESAARRRYAKALSRLQVIVGSSTKKP